jgi:hypothetical protein
MTEPTEASSARFIMIELQSNGVSIKDFLHIILNIMDLYIIE